MANIIRMSGNDKGKKILFKDGQFAEGLNPSGYTLDGNEIKISGNKSFMMDYSEPNKLIFVRWYSPSGQANSYNSFPTLLNVKTTVNDKNGFMDFSAISDIDYISCISSHEGFQIYKTYGLNDIKIKEIWSESIGGGS